MKRQQDQERQQTKLEEDDRKDKETQAKKEQLPKLTKEELIQQQIKNGKYPRLLSLFSVHSNDAEDTADECCISVATGLAWTTTQDAELG